jgi:carboxyl-terminal processing protease
LSNPKDSEAPKRSIDDSKNNTADKADDKKTDDKKPTEPGSKTDYQFSQALNLLKGLQILQQK